VGSDTPALRAEARCKAELLKRRAVARAGTKEPFRLYDLGHTYAVRAVMAGADLPTLAALLGHSSIRMTTRYVRPAEEHKREAAAQLEVFKFAAMQKAVEKTRGRYNFRYGEGQSAERQSG